MNGRILRLWQVLKDQPPAYIWCRFKVMRDLFAVVQRLRFGAPPKRQGNSEFPDINPADVRASMHAHSYADGFVLQAETVQQILTDLPQMTATDVKSKRKFRVADLQERRTDHDPVALAFVDGLESHPTVQRLLRDPKLLASAEACLGYPARSVKVLLYLSFAGQFTLEERRQSYQTVEFHFDVHAMNFCYAHFYLTDTDQDSGAHVLVRGSHRAKPLQFLLGSARASDAAIEEHYGRDRIVVLEGPSGTGFLEDTSCFHKALAPMTRDRFMLQIRYGS